MNKQPNLWSKEEFRTYLLLLSGKADSKLSKKEQKLIARHTDPSIYKKMMKEIEKDDANVSLDKLEAAVSHLKYTNMELMDLRKEVTSLFKVDKKFSAAEKYLDRIFDNIIY